MANNITFFLAHIADLTALTADTTVALLLFLLPDSLPCGKGKD